MERAIILSEKQLIEIAKQASLLGKVEVLYHMDEVSIDYLIIRKNEYQRRIEEILKNLDRLNISD